MNQTKICCMCGSNHQDVLNLGEMMVLGNLIVHYYCLLLASTITQSGQDDEGILGFLQKDIIDELNRCKNRLCTYCGVKGASVFCSAKNCKISFHLPCGLKHGSGHQFQGSFLSTCHIHRVRQKYIVPTSSKCCPICYEIINFKEWSKILWAPCCKKNAYFHKQCLQKMALSAGYFFKCPICNDKQKFQKTMKIYGVFIPDRDASWEMEPNAFQELYYRHNECNAEECLCDQGRKHTGSGQWSIILCSDCGSQGTHIACLNGKTKYSWICKDCFAYPNAAVIKENELTELSSTESQPSCSTTINTLNNSKNLETFENCLQNDQYINAYNNGIKKEISDDTETINILDSEDDDDILIVEEVQPHVKCLIAQDGSVIPVRIIDKREDVNMSSFMDVQGDIHMNESKMNQMKIENLSPTSSINELGFKITDVRSLSTSSFKSNKSSNEIDKDLLKNGDNQNTLNGESKHSEDVYTMKQALYSAMCDSYKVDGNGIIIEDVFNKAIKEEIIDMNGGGYDSTSDNDVIIID